MGGQVKSENDSSNLAKLDISQESIKIEPKPGILSKPIYTPYHKDNDNRFLYRIKRKKDHKQKMNATLLEYSTKLEVYKRKKEESANPFNAERSSFKLL